MKVIERLTPVEIQLRSPPSLLTAAPSRHALFPERNALYLISAIFAEPFNILGANSPISRNRKLETTLFGDMIPAIVRCQSDRSTPLATEAA
jgi:hypothetical protein